MNTQVPATTYANWFSYRTADFISENWEILKAIMNTRTLFTGMRLRFVGDSGLDDQKVFGWMDKAEAEFVIRASHLERIVEAYNDRGDVSYHIIDEKSCGHSFAIGCSGTNVQIMAARQVLCAWRALVLPGKIRDGDESGGNERRLSIGQQLHRLATQTYYMRPIKLTS